MKNSKIEWTTHTFNPWTGCTKVSPACDHCYAERWSKRAGRSAWGPGQPRLRTSEKNWTEPQRWNAEAARLGVRARVFCASLADVFDNEVPPEWRADLFALIQATPHLDWLLLTKRIGNAKDMMLEARRALAQPMDPVNRDPLPNVWIGATICDQAEADRDIPKLLATPAHVRFLSMEPLLGSVDLTNIRLPLADESFTEGNVLMHKSTLDRGNSRPAIDWIIVGGESGPQARPMHPNWARSLRDQCEQAGVAFLFKQWGEWVPRSSCYHTFEDGTDCASLDPGATRWPSLRLTEQGHNGRDLAHAGEGDDAYMQRVGKEMAGRLLDGRTWDEVPA